MYATAPPESVAAIIFRDPERIEEAVAVSKSTAKYLRHFKVVDSLIPQTKSVMDADGLADNIKIYLEKTIKDLSRRRLDKLMEKRFETADELGVVDRGKFFEIKRFIEQPLKHLYKAPPQLKLISDPSGATIHLEDTYGDGTVIDPSQPLVRCGHEEEGAKGDGCGGPDPPGRLSEELPDLPQLRQASRVGRSRLDQRPGRPGQLSRAVSQHDGLRPLARGRPARLLPRVLGQAAGAQLVQRVPGNGPRHHPRLPGGAGP